MADLERPQEEPEVEPFDASDKDQIDKRKREAGRRRKADRDVLHGLMKTPQGRAWLHAKIAECHVFEASVNVENPNQMFFREGERNVGAKLNVQCATCNPDLYCLMLKENARG